MNLTINGFIYKMLIISEMSILPLFLTMLSSFCIHKWIQVKYKNRLKFVIKLYWVPLSMALITFLICYIFGYNFTQLLEIIEHETHIIESTSHISHLKYLLFSFRPIPYLTMYGFIGFGAMYKDSTNPINNSSIIKKRENKK